MVVSERAGMQLPTRLPHHIDIKTRDKQQKRILRDLKYIPNTLALFLNLRGQAWEHWAGCHWLWPCLSDGVDLRVGSRVEVG